MLEDQPQYSDRREGRPQGKEQKYRARQRARSLRVFKNYAITIVVVAAAGWGIYFLSQGSTPQGEDFSRAVPLMDTNHIEVGSSLPEYTSNPPTSGPHYVQTARSGFREEVISDQHLIHNLEHGDIWIAYHPSVSDEVREELGQFTAAKVVVTPREANDNDIALAAWGRLDTFDVENNVVPVERIKDFIKRYTNKGPEQVPGASGGV